MRFVAATIAAAIAGCLWAAGSIAPAADRTTLLIPLPAGETSTPPDLPTGRFADELMDVQSDASQTDAGWNSYIRLWKSHYRNPSSRSIRRFLGLPSDESFRWSARRGRTSPRSLRWRPGSFAQIETAHYQIASRASEVDSRRVAIDLERCYWIWTQMFFPLWESSAQVSAAFEGLTPEQSVEDFLNDHPERLSPAEKLRVVLFRDAGEYRRALTPHYPGVENSTGFYASDRRTIYLYAAEVDDASTRRHEATHQLFREATRCGLGRDFPGEREGFWLVEGIAGYFESLQMNDSIATLGGWDSSRLQFARYRTLVLGDQLELGELQRDGRIDAQQRADLARWYAHSIAHTHRLIDGGDPASRAWVYRQLAKLYQIRRVALPSVDESSVISDSGLRLRRFLSVDDNHLQSNPVSHPLQQLVLAECPVSRDGVNSIRSSTALQWLDLTRINVTTDDVRRLAPDPNSLRQLRLEATRIDPSIGTWLEGATALTELDLSWTTIDDSVLHRLAGFKKLSVLYLTGTKVSGDLLPTLLSLPALETVDLQRTGFSQAELNQLRQARPGLEINPLQLRE